MTDVAKKIYDALNDVTVMCAECQHYGEPFGCNRRGGSCIAYDFILDAADLIERLSTELERVKRERDAAIRDARRGGHCVKCKHWGTHRCLDCCYSFGEGENDNWQWRGVCEENSKDGAE